MPLLVLTFEEKARCQVPLLAPVLRGWGY